MPSRVFIGPNGLRAGWRALIYIVICIVSAIVAARILPTAIHQARAAVLQPGLSLLWESSQLLIVLAVTGAFALVERRSWRDYGLPWNQTLGRRFWLGVVWGFVAISCEIFITYAGGGIAFGGFAVAPGEGVRYAAEWTAVFLFVAAFEELLFRGYLLQTLARGMGFWAAAILLSAIFGAVHLRNSGEAFFGAFQAAMVGLLFCFTVHRTGSLWFAIGLHAAWDYGESFVYSVPDSGLVARGHLLQTAIHGPWWLTGGTVGPEGSLVCGIVMLGVFILAWFFLRRPRVMSSHSGYDVTNPS